MFQQGANYVDHTFRVRYAETDAMGVVHNATYLTWVEIGRTEYCIAKGVPYSEIEKSGIALVVAEANIRFKKPAYYEEMVTVRTAISKLASRVAKFSYQILRSENGELIAEGETVHVSVNNETGRPTPMPRYFIDQMTQEKKS
jgi:acyl-CoA thioester hydrolase